MMVHPTCCMKIDVLSIAYMDTSSLSNKVTHCVLAFQYYKELTQRATFQSPHLFRASEAPILEMVSANSPVR
jgi:hypothetical protein